MKRVTASYARARLYRLLDLLAEDPYVRESHRTEALAMADAVSHCGRRTRLKERHRRS